MQATANQGTPGIAERLFVVLVLLLSTGAFLNLGMTKDSDSLDPRPGVQAVWLLVYLVTIPEFLKCRRAVINRIKSEFWLIIFIAFVFASTFWSVDPLITARRAIAFACTTLFGLYFAVRYPLKDQIRLLACAFSIAAVSSVFFQLLGLGTNHAEGVPGWTGVYTQKNGFGVNMAFATGVLLIVTKADPKYRSWAAFGSAVTFVLLLFARSAVAVVMVLSMLVIFIFRRVLRKSVRLTAFAGLMTASLAAYILPWVFDHLDRITALLGRDPTLTGRVPLWILCTVMALQKPWLGYGYTAFWQTRGGDTVRHVVGWAPASAHNGFLEIWLGLGIIGLALFVITFLIYLRRAIVFTHAADGVENLWPLLYLGLIFLATLSESSTIPQQNSFSWILYVATGLTSFQLASSPARREVELRRHRY